MSRSDDDAECERQERDQEQRRARRRQFVDRFAAAQRRERRWIALPDLALYCASTGAMTAAGAYRHLAELLRRGEISDARGRSRVLFLDPEPHQIPGQHRLSAAMIDGSIWAEAPIDQRSGGPAPLDAYAEADFAPRKVEENSETREVPAFVVSEFLECSYLLRDDARRVLERLGLAWPPHFDPASPRPVGTQGAPAATEPSARTPGSERRRGRGRRPDKAAAVEAAMRRDLAAGIDVVGMIGKAMADRYGASRDTCRRVRDALLCRE